LTDHLARQREEDDGTVAKKAQKRLASRKASTKSAKSARRPAGKAAKNAPAKAKTTASSKPAASTGPGLGHRAERLRDEIMRSKLTHPDPWAYASKARAWGERAQVLVELIVVRGDSPAALRTLEVLHAEVEGDRDFQAARRLF
jgi:outer membrane biosynthesis protein TonB